MRNAVTFLKSNQENIGTESVESGIQIGTESLNLVKLYCFSYHGRNNICKLLFLVSEKIPI